MATDPYAGGANAANTATPITQQGTQPTLAQSMANSNATGVNAQGQMTYGATVAAPYGYTGTTPNAAPAQAPAQYGYSPSGIPYGGPGSNDMNPNSAVYGAPSGAAGAAAYALGGSFTPPESKTDFETQDMASNAVQAQIDAINSQFSNAINQQENTNAANLTATNAALTQRGLMGSNVGASSYSGAQTAGNQAVAAIQAEQAQALAGVYAQVDANAQAQAQNAAAQATTDANTYAANQQNIAASAQTQVAQLAKLGQTSTSIQANDPQLWDTLKSQSGYSDYQLQVSLDTDPNNPNSKQTTQTYAANPSDPNSTIVRRISIDPQTGKSTETDYTIALPYNQADPNAFQVLNGTLYHKEADGTLTPQIPEPYKAAAQGAQVYSTTTGATVDSWGLPTSGTQGTATAPDGTVSPIITQGTGTYSTSTDNNPLNVMADSSSSALAAKAQAAGATVKSFTDAQGNTRTAFAFPDLATGMKFGEDTLFSSYANSTVADALSKWSNGAYGADAAKAAGVDPAAKMSDLPQSQRDALTKQMVIREGGALNTQSTVAKANQAGLPLWAQNSGLDVKQLQTLQSIPGMTQSDALNVAAIMTGQAPPPASTSGSSSNSKAMLNLKAGLAAMGYNVSKAVMDWQAMQTRIKSMNSTQMVRLQQAVNFSYDSLDIVDQLNQAWQGGDFPVLNKATLAAAKQGVDKHDLAQPVTINTVGTDGTTQTLTITNTQELANAMDAQISDLTSELGTVYKGGNSSTDDSLSLAAQNLSSDWSEDTLNAAINQARTNLQLRKNSIATSSAIPGNIYSAPAVGSTVSDASNLPDGTQVQGDDGQTYTIQGGQSVLSQ